MDSHFTVQLSTFIFFLFFTGDTFSFLFFFSKSCQKNQIIFFTSEFCPFALNSSKKIHWDETDKSSHQLFSGIILVLQFFPPPQTLFQLFVYNSLLESQNGA